MTDLASPAPTRYPRGKRPAKHLSTLRLHDHLPQYATFDDAGLFAEYQAAPQVTWLMLGNGPDPSAEPAQFQSTGVGDCVAVAAENNRMGKAIAAFDSTGAPIFEVGFRRPHAPYTMGLYFGYGRSMGEPGGAWPDEGVVMADYFLYLYKTGVIGGFAEIDLTAPNAHAQLWTAIVEYRGIVCGYQPDDDFDQEYASRVPFGTLSSTPDPAEGHGMYVDGWKSNGNELPVTWARQCEATPEWSAHCRDEAWVIFTHEDVERLPDKGASLIAALEALPDAHVPVLTQPVADDVVSRATAVETASFVAAGGGLAGALRHLEAEAEKLMRDVADPAIRRAITQVAARELERLAAAYFHV